MLKRLFFLVAKLPNKWAQIIGNSLGTVLFYVNHREKRVARVNIALCFPELSPVAQQQLLKATLKENAKTFCELPRIFVQGGQFALDLITEVDGIAHYHHALEKGQGVVLLAPHLGNWELTVHYLNQFSTITAMFDPPKQPFLSEIMREGRQSTGATLVPADGTGVRAQLKQLKKGGVIGILPDQVPAHDNAGIFAPFMGQSAFTMTLVSNLVRRSDATVLLTFAERLGVGEGYRLHVIPAPQAIYDSDTTVAVTALNQAIAECVKKAPAQYQWTYKRFKRRPHDVPDVYANT